MTRNVCTEDDDFIPPELEDLQEKLMAGDESVCDGIDLKWMYGQDEDDVIDSPTPKTYEKMSVRGHLRRIFLRSPKSRMASTFFDIAVKGLCCLLYFIRVQVDEIQEYNCRGLPCYNNTKPDLSTSNEEDGMVFSSAAINWHVLLWVYRPWPLWIIQAVLAVATFCKAILLISITKENKLDQFTSSLFVIEVLVSIPFIFTMCYPTMFKDLYVPGFLNCWLLKNALERLFNDLHVSRQRFQTISVTMTQQMFILVVTVCCICFTTICGIQHLQRASLEKPLTMFESFYFTIVTFSTVGYGDISPDIWPGQLFMVVMIVVAIAFIPRQIERITTTWMERKKTGGVYSKSQAKRGKHVVVCCQKLTAEAVMNFLTEFYAHRKLQNHIVILLCPLDPADDMHMILRDPKWSNRVRYMKGSALKDIDLMRCRISQAECVFLLSPPENNNKEQAGSKRDRYKSQDKQIILRSWALRDFAPNCNQYIQLFRAENKMHVKFAEHVVCEDEFKYALLANNCLYPGMSTLVSLLLHTSTGCEGDLTNETWQQIYGKHSGNEIYHIQVCNSQIFGQFSGRKFTDASVEAHEKYGVTLLAVMDVDCTKENGEPRIQLNPGSSYILKETDFCFYMSVSKEENTKISLLVKPTATKSEREKNYQKIAMELQRVISKHDIEDMDEEYGEESVFNTLNSLSGREMASNVLDLQRPKIDVTLPVPVIKLPEQEQREELDTSKSGCASEVFEEYTVGRPPPTFFISPKNTECHLMKVMRSKCCLKWGEDCAHVTYKNASSSKWGQNLIILTAQHINHGLYNFILPLRSCFISLKSIKPIILMFEEDEPSTLFLETIAHFPLVFWMNGKLTCIDDLLKAGINKASHVVVVNRELALKPEQMVDAETIVDVQTVHKLFPNINILTELSSKDNMRFMNFHANDEYSLNISKLEKKLKENNCIMTHMFRLPFAAGNVLSGAMLDTLLYQTFVKGYLIKFVRLLLGIDAEHNSGHLSSINVKRHILRKYRTYGELYKGLCTVTGEIPIAIYRTDRRKDNSNNMNTTSSTSHQENNNFKPGKPMERKVTINVRPFYERAEQNDASELIRSRMKSLHMDDNSYCSGEQVKTVSYIILNPTSNRKLKAGDIVYVIQPCSMFAVPSRLHKKPIRRMSWTSAADAVMHNKNNRSRSQSVHNDVSSQTIHEISYQSPPLDLGMMEGGEPKKEVDVNGHSKDVTTDDNDNNESDQTPQDIARRISSRFFVTEKVADPLV